MFTKKVKKEYNLLPHTSKKINNLKVSEDDQRVKKKSSSNNKKKISVRVSLKLALDSRKIIFNSEISWSKRDRDVYNTAPAKRISKGVLVESQDRCLLNYFFFIFQISEKEERLFLF